MNGLNRAAPWLAQTSLAVLALLPCAGHAAGYSVFGSVIAGSSLQVNFQPPEGGPDIGSSFRFTDDPQALQPNALQAVSTVSKGMGKALFLGSIGSLKAYAFASFADGVGPFNFPIFSGQAKGEAGGEFFDRLVVTGAGLAVGTPVSYRLDFSIDGTLSSPSFEPSYLATFAWATVRLSDQDLGRRVEMSWRAGADAPGIFSLTLATQVGSNLLIEGALGASAKVDAFARTGRSAEADFYHSALYMLTPSVAGLNTVGASGHNFLAPVPEPSSWALFGGGLLALGWLQRRRGRRRFAS
jgi:hypothetical protein